jgi:hypothetical protein
MLREERPISLWLRHQKQESCIYQSLRFLIGAYLRLAVGTVPKTIPSPAGQMADSPNLWRVLLSFRKDLFLEPRHTDPATVICGRFVYERGNIGWFASFDARLTP